VFYFPFSIISVVCIRDSYALTTRPCFQRSLTLLPFLVHHLLYTLLYQRRRTLPWSPPPFPVHLLPFTIGSSARAHLLYPPSNSNYTSAFSHCTVRSSHPPQTPIFLSCLSLFGSRLHRTFLTGAPPRLRDFSVLLPVTPSFFHYPFLPSHERFRVVLRRCRAPIKMLYSPTYAHFTFRAILLFRLSSPPPFTPQNQSPTLSS